jgi:hypothetical protein
MSRAIILVCLLLPQWCIPFFVPSIADEYRFREFGITSYPGWTDTQLWTLGLCLVLATHGLSILSLSLFHRWSPLPLVPHRCAWTCFLVTFVSYVIHALVTLRPVSLGLAIAAVGLYLMITVPRLRFTPALVPRTE